MSKKENGTNQIKISISPQNVFVHIAISDVEGKLINEFNLSPFDALSVANSIIDASVFARVEPMIQKQLNERK